MIELSNLEKVIDGRTVLAIESLKVEEGEVAALVGPAGSGKEALFDLLIGRSRPTLGAVRLQGLEPEAEKQSLSQQVGVLYAEDSLYMQRSCRSNLELFARLYGLPRERVDHMLVQVGLADHAGVRVDKLSSGLARRLAFGRAILHHPKMLLLLEPFARCDEASISLDMNR